MSEPRLCVTVTAPTTLELRRLRDEAAKVADLVELRLDSVRDPDVAGALADRRSPVIVTCRPEWEGGRFGGSEEERKRILADALAAGAEYVDVEWRSAFDDLIARQSGRRIILSMHDFDGVPADLAARFHAMKSTGAEVVKLAVQTHRLSDCVPLLECCARAREHNGVVLLGMGEHGLATRVLAARFGSLWTYAGTLRDIGQISAASLLDDFSFRHIRPSTELYGVVGRSVSHSVSPAMHNAAFRAVKRNAVYLPLPSPDADDFITFARAIGLKGASVTIPHKVALFDRLQAIDGNVDVTARRIGAINTIRIDDDGKWNATNTDAIGFLTPLRERLAIAGLRASVVGAGGAARAVAVALTSAGASVTLHARDSSKAHEVARETGARAGSWPPARESWDLLVNCTPLGMHPRLDETPIAAELLTGRYVYDLVYNPAVTRLAREAAAAGCETIGGLEMLVAQAEQQFKWWTGTDAPVGVMREAAMKQLAESARHENYVV